ncbi:MAG: hypothetical protein OXT67_10265 [Zetaproteobacteria bacterium]|nr:hypothetical protein [Zetaproteobacteria bacterium]
MFERLCNQKGLVLVWMVWLQLGVPVAVAAIPIHYDVSSRELLTVVFKYCPQEMQAALLPADYVGEVVKIAEEQRETYIVSTVKSSGYPSHLETEVAQLRICLDQLPRQSAPAAHTPLQWQTRCDLMIH